jgi:hypothetical protein
MITEKKIPSRSSTIKRRETIIIIKQSTGQTMKDLSNECEKTKAIYRSRED